VSGDHVLIWVVVSAILGAAVAWVPLAREAEHRQRLRLGGRTAKAHVCGLDGDSLCASYWAKLQYDNNGRSVTSLVPVSGAQYQRLRVGTDIVVTYLPGQPDSARPADLERGMCSEAGHELSAGEAERLRRLAR
jgi:hypothetical protein